MFGGSQKVPDDLSLPMGSSSSTQKPWYNDNTNSRILPFTVIPRSLKSSKKLSNNPDSGSDNDRESDEDSSGDDSDSEKSREEDHNSLDTQVKKLLVGPVSSEFGSKKFKQLSFGNKNGGSELKNSHLLINDVDAPPRLTLDDEIFQDDDGNNKTNNNVNSNDGSNNGSSKDNKILAMHASVNPDSFNVFNANFSNIFSKNPINNTNSGVLNYLSNQSSNSNNFNSHSSLSISKQPDTKNFKKEKTENGNEYSIIVYGYKESDSTQIIQYFTKYGEILESFEVLNNKRNLSGYFKYGKSNKMLPIYIGEGWVKLTYNQESCLRVLKEKKIIFNDYYVKIEPCTPEILQKFLNKSINVEVEYCDSSDLENQNDAAQILFPHRSKQKNKSSDLTPDGENSTILPKPSQNPPSKIFSILENYVPETVMTSSNKVANFLNRDTSPFKTQAEDVDKEEEISSKRAKLNFEENNHKLKITSGKQVMLVKNKRNTAGSNKKLNVNSPSNQVENETWIEKGLDWAFGFNTL